MSGKSILHQEEPQELGKNSTIFFAMKDLETRDYDLVGEGKPTFVGPLTVRDRDEKRFFRGA